MPSNGREVVIVHFGSTCAAAHHAFTLCLALAPLAGIPYAIAADVVTDWGARGVAIGAEKQLPNARYTRNLAMMHVAMFEAVNAVDRRYEPYKLDLPGDKGA
jgi:hypothetical protein